MTKTLKIAISKAYTKGSINMTSGITGKNKVNE